MQAAETYPIIIAILQAPKQTDREREQVTMLLAPHTPFEDIAECLLGEPMTITEAVDLLDPGARDERRERGLSHDRIKYAVMTGINLESVARNLNNIDPMSELVLHEHEVVLQRVPRVVTCDSLFSFIQDNKSVTESYEDFMFRNEEWVWDQLTQDYSIEGSYLPTNGGYSLLDLVNLWVWERGVWEMGCRLNVNTLTIQTCKDGACL